MALHTDYPTVHSSLSLSKISGGWRSRAAATLTDCRLVSVADGLFRQFVNQYARTHMVVLLYQERLKSPEVVVAYFHAVSQIRSSSLSLWGMRH